MTKEIEMAEENVKEILTFIKDEPQFQGKYLPKSELRARFKMPCSRSTLVWAMLRGGGHNWQNHTRYMVSPIYHNEQPKQQDKGQKKAAFK